MEQTQAFAKMLEQIYEWLSEINATAGGNIHEVSFDFSLLKEKVSVSLDSFPKTYIRKWVDRLALTRTFNPEARGRLRVDTPNYWRDDVNALSNLCYAPVLMDENAFRALPKPNKRLVAIRVEHLVSALRQHYIRKTAPPDIKHWQFTNHPVLYLRDESQWTRALNLGAQLESVGGAETGHVASALFELFRAAIDRGEMAPGMHLESFLDRLRAAGLSEGPDAVAPIFGADLESDDTYAFLTAFDCCFPTQKVQIRELVELVDRVLLPFWRHRWRLFEIWSLIWLIQTVPDGYRMQPSLSRSTRGDGGYVWILSGGDAAEPVARAGTGDNALSIWFQLKTPLATESAELFRQCHIEPDIRIRREIPGESNDIVILELKDRHLAQGRDEKRVAHMYATTGAPVVCVANYSLFGSQGLRGAVYKEEVGTTQIFIVDEFRPDTVPSTIRRAILHALSGNELPDVLIDVSGSMNINIVSRVLDQLAQLDVNFERWFAWSENCAELRDRSDLVCRFGGATNLQEALKAHSAVRKARGLIITDDDGARQFRDLLRAGLIQEGRYLCLDAAQSVVASKIDPWFMGPSL
ncbi:MAG: hypothetical protein ACYDBH_18815 [Acidobacteriaceae bacterium]